MRDQVLSLTSRPVLMPGVDCNCASLADVFDKAVESPGFKMHLGDILAAQKETPAPVTVAKGGRGRSGAQK